MALLNWVALGCLLGLTNLVPLGAEYRWIVSKNLNHWIALDFWEAF